MTKDKRRDPKALAGEILSRLAAHPPTPPDAPQLPEPEPDDADRDAAAADLIEVYFTLDEPVERDVAFEKLSALRTPVVTAFFAAMMENDEDDHMRTAAAAELARRGEAAGVAHLESLLTDAPELHALTDAVQVLGELRGPAFYDTLLALWRDGARDPAERREFMIGMETVDAARAMRDFVAFVAAIDDVHRMPDDQVEQAMAAFVRQGYVEAVPTLRGLRAKILAARWDDADEAQELAAFVQEGIELLEA